MGPFRNRAKQGLGTGSGQQFLLPPYQRPPWETDPVRPYCTWNSLLADSPGMGERPTPSFPLCSLSPASEFPSPAAEKDANPTVPQQALAVQNPRHGSGLWAQSRLRGSLRSDGRFPCWAAHKSPLTQL